MHMLVELLREEFGAQVRLLDIRPQRLPHSIMGTVFGSFAVSCLLNGLECVRVQTIVLLGHSTGCQENVRYMQKIQQGDSAPGWGHPAGTGEVYCLSLPTIDSGAGVYQDICPQSHRESLKGACRRCKHAFWSKSMHLQVSDREALVYGLQWNLSTGTAGTSNGGTGARRGHPDAASGTPAAPLLSLRADTSRSRHREVQVTMTCSAVISLTRSSRSAHFLPPPCPLLKPTQSFLLAAKCWLCQQRNFVLEH